MTANLRIGIEVELSAKWGRDLDDFVMGIAKALETSSDQPSRYSRFIIVSDSNAIITRYKDALSPGAKLNIWKKDQRKYWGIDKTIAVPKWLIEKIDFQLIGR